jgi:hypothetical protein
MCSILQAVQEYVITGEFFGPLFTAYRQEYIIAFVGVDTRYALGPSS